MRIYGGMSFTGRPYAGVGTSLSGRRNRPCRRRYVKPIHKWSAAELAPLGRRRLAWMLAWRVGFLAFAAYCLIVAFVL